MAAPLDRVKALLAALPAEDQKELQRYLADILVTEDEAEGIHLASLQEKTKSGATITYTYRQERVRCGKAGCWCAENGLGHGPYTYKYWKEDGKLRKEYVGKAPPSGVEPVDARSGPRARVSRRRAAGRGARGRGSTAGSSSSPAPPA